MLYCKQYYSTVFFIVSIPTVDTASIISFPFCYIDFFFCKHYDCLVMYTFKTMFRTCQNKHKKMPELIECDAYNPF